MHKTELAISHHNYHTKCQPSCHSKSYGSRAFSVSAPGMWRTKVPMDIKCCPIIAIFEAETQNMSFLNENLITF